GQHFISAELVWVALHAHELPRQPFIRVHQLLLASAAVPSGYVVVSVAGFALFGRPAVVAAVEYAWAEVALNLSGAASSEVGGHGAVLCFDLLSSKIYEVSVFGVFKTV